MSDKYQISQEVMKWIISIGISFISILLSIIVFFFMRMIDEIDRSKDRQDINTKAVEYLLKKDKYFDGKINDNDREWDNLYRNYDLQKKQ